MCLGNLTNHHALTPHIPTRMHQNETGLGVRGGGGEDVACSRGFAQAVAASSATVVKKTTHAVQLSMV